MRYWKNINQIQLGGHITAKPTEREVGVDKTKVAEFTVANNYLNSKDYKAQDTGHFFTCQAWGVIAERAIKTLDKGVQVTVTGSLHHCTWQGDDGVKKSTYRIEVDNFYINNPPGSKQGEKYTEAEPPRATNPAAKTATPPPLYASTPVNNAPDDIPF